MNHSKEEIKKYRAAFHQQKSNAKNRGIEWKLTFDEWIEWWGDDIKRRGSSACSLQMQRYADQGAYELGNIKKGYPRQNTATWVNVWKTKKALKAKQEHEAFLDALMFAASKEEKDNWIPEEDYCPASHNGIVKRHAFTLDKKM